MCDYVSITGKQPEAFSLLCCVVYVVKECFRRVLTWRLHIKPLLNNITAGCWIKPLQFPGLRVHLWLMATVNE